MTKGLGVGDSMSVQANFSHVPIIDVQSLIAGDADAQHDVAKQIGRACRESGFFYVVGHGVDPALIESLQSLSRQFFARETAEKMRISMAAGGRAWRGYFRVGDELTSGQPDQKEGLYFGAELASDHPLVLAGTPLHGPNLFPQQPAELRAVVLEYMTQLTQLGQRLMAGIAISLGLEASYFDEHGTADPLTLFRIFNYPAQRDENLWGVGEHSDYGLLTILLQDDVGGLEVKSGATWIAAPPIAGSFVCNLGDMLDRMTRGLYRSTPHRVRNAGTRDRLSFPFFFDPNFFAPVQPIELPEAPPDDDQQQRWDRASVHTFAGTYGEYLLEKVGQMFPELGGQVF